MRAAASGARMAARVSHATDPEAKAMRGAAASAQPDPTSARQALASARTHAPVPAQPARTPADRTAAPPVAPPVAPRVGPPGAEPETAGLGQRSGAPLAAQRGAGSAVTRTSTRRFGSRHS